MAEIKVVSFDLDGTLFDSSFADSVWLEEIPRLYSVSRGISLVDAKKAVRTEYNEVGNERLEWYDLPHWIRKFDLDVTARELLKRSENRIRIYPEVPEVLQRLKQRGFRLIIITNARREFADLELAKAKIEDWFEHVFSSTTDFKMVKKTVETYQRVCNILEVSSQEIVHVGDDKNFDFDVPRKLGMLAFLLDRTGEKEGEFIIHNLKELNTKLQTPALI